MSDEFAPQLDQLEAQHAAKKTSSSSDDGEVEYMDVTQLAVLMLEKSAELHRNTAILLEYIGDDTFCKNITKRERDAIARQLDKIYAASDEIDEVVESIQDDEEEEETET